MMGHPQYVRRQPPLEDGMNRKSMAGRIMELFASGLLNDEMLKVEFSEKGTYFRKDGKDCATFYRNMTIIRKN